MEESIRKVFETDPPRAEIWPVLTLAYVGDSVFELMLRTAFAEQHIDKGNALNARVQQYSAARGQAKMALRIQPLLTEEEAAVYRRGRNAHPESVSRHASLSEYHKATGLEALLGYLYLKGRIGRAAEIVKAGIQDGENTEENG